MTHANLTQQAPENPERRTFFEKSLHFVMFGVLALAYGKFASFAARFLFPAKPREKGWLYVAEVSRMKKGDSLAYRAPDGAEIAVARQGMSGQIEDFIALSSTCPHLGCKVHWEGPSNRFFCPCHNGIFDPNGKAISGPPADAKQSLSKYPLKIEKDILYIQVPFGKLEAYERPLHLPKAPGTSSPDRFFATKH